jgi:hypothetical protein
MVQEAVAGQVIVEADDVRASLARRKLVEGLLGHLLAQPLVKRMPLDHSAKQQVEGQPAALVVVLRLVRQRIGGERLPHVLGCQEP